jgi:hypothetical protein
LTDSKDTSWNADLMDERLNQKTDNSTILYQASVFNEQSRIFAPRYRQAHIRCFYTDDTRAKDAFEIAYQDIRASFIYYLEHNNQGRPIIIASHSQGTKHAGRLLKEFFENQPLMRSLVCAYIIGMPVPEDYFKELKPCSDENQTGCFVAWRSFQENYIPEFVKEEKFKSVVVNPLSWKINDEKISRKKNAGGVLMKFDKIVPKVVSAQIHHNILWCSKPNVFGKIFIRKKNYHIGDINLFYMNIRENVKNRLKNYLSEGKL